MVSPAQVDQAVDAASRLEGLAAQHREYRIMESLPDVADHAGEMRHKLEQYVKAWYGDGSASGSLTPEQKRIAALVGVMVSAGRGDRQLGDLDYLQRLVVLKRESELGRTDVVAFQQAARYQLAHSSEGYTPVQTIRSDGGRTYDVFTDRSQKKVVLLEQQGMWFLSAQLKTALRLDDLLGDFSNYANGTSRVVEAEKKRHWQNSCALGMIPGILGSIAVGVAMYYGISEALTPNFDASFIKDMLKINPEYYDHYNLWETKAFNAKAYGLLGGIISGIISLFPFTEHCPNFFYRRSGITQRCKELKAQFPHEYIKTGVEGILDAFPFMDEVPTGETASEPIAVERPFEQGVGSSGETLPVQKVLRVAGLQRT